MKEVRCGHEHDTLHGYGDNTTAGICVATHTRSEDQTEREIYIMSQSLCTLFPLTIAYRADPIESGGPHAIRYLMDEMHCERCPTCEPGNQTVPPGVYD